MIESITNLNETIYKLFAECEDNRKFLSAEAYKIIREALLWGYKKELEIIKLKIEREHLTLKHTTLYQNAWYIPRYKRLWYTLWIKKRPNRSAEDIDTDEDIMATKYFTEYEGRIQKAQEALQAMLQDVEEHDNGDALRLEEKDEEEPPKKRKRKKIEPSPEILEQLEGQISMEGCIQSGSRNDRNPL